MKVKELIKELQKHNPEQEVIIGAEGVFQGTPNPKGILVQDNKVYRVDKDGRKMWDEKGNEVIDRIDKVVVIWG